MKLPGGVFLNFSRPLVMSVVNCTPDSFFPPSRTAGPEEAAEAALKAEAEGADIVDFGAESTRPGAGFVDEEEEIRRLIPALRSFRRRSALPLSVDTRRAAVARLALDEGADIINDISAFADPAMIPLCTERKAALVIMHGYTVTPAAAGSDIAENVGSFLIKAAEKAAAGGIAKEKIIIDPGFGFGKSTAENSLLLNRLAIMDRGDYPLLVGVSHKRFIGEITGRETEERLGGTLAASVIAILRGADIIRAHDTTYTADMLQMLKALDCF